MSTNYYDFSSEKELMMHICNYVRNEKHIIIPEIDIKNIYHCLKTQKLVILNSKPGMGKTEICLAYAEAFKAFLDKDKADDSVEIIFLSIDKDYDKSDLLGYVGLDEVYHPSYFAQKIFNLNEEGQHIETASLKMYFVILDEMNLSQIDYYFNKILSGIENNQEIVLPNNIKVKLPQNTFFMGTINSFTYESTRNPVSGGVKRRANIINVKNPLDQIFEYESIDQQKQAFKEIMDAIIAQSKDNFSKTSDVLAIFRALNFEYQNEPAEQFYDLIFDLVKCLSRVEDTKLTLGILQDVIEYLIFADFDFEKALDYQIVQKILPHITCSIESITEFRNYLIENNLKESSQVLAQMITAAQHNMGNIIPLC